MRNILHAVHLVRQYVYGFVNQYLYGVAFSDIIESCLTANRDIIQPIVAISVVRHPIQK